MPMCAHMHPHIHTHIQMFISSSMKQNPWLTNVIIAPKIKAVLWLNPALVRILEIYNPEALYATPRQPYKSEKHVFYSCCICRPAEGAFKYLSSFCFPRYVTLIFLLCLVSLSITSWREYFKPVGNALHQYSLPTKNIHSVCCCCCLWLNWHCIGLSEYIQSF